MAMKIYHEIETNTGKTWGFMLGFLLLVIGVGFVFAQYYGNPGILYIAVAFSVAMNVAGYWFSDKLVLATMRAKPANPQEPAQLELIRTVENLSITAGLPMPKVYIVEDASPNAFATGRDKNHAVVAVTTGIMAILDKSELEGVLAHEISHIGNRDILLSTVAVVLVGFISILADMFLRMSAFGGGNREGGKGNALFLILAIVAAILAPLAANLMKLAVSRKRELLADASGVLLTRYPEALATALIKISQNPQPLKRASHTTAHLFISDPLKENIRGKASWMTKMFLTHPPVDERVAALRGMNVEAVRKMMERE